MIKLMLNLLIRHLVTIFSVLLICKLSDYLLKDWLFQTRSGNLQIGSILTAWCEKNCPHKAVDSFCNCPDSPFLLYLIS